MSELSDGLMNVQLGVYVKPEIVCELDLETRAGTQLIPPKGLADPLGLDPNSNSR